MIFGLNNILFQASIHLQHKIWHKDLTGSQEGYGSVVAWEGLFIIFMNWREVGVLPQSRKVAFY